MLFIWLQFNQLIISALILFVWGAIVFIRLPSQFNFVSETVPTEHLPQVHSILQISFVIPNMLAGLIVAFIGDQYSSYEILSKASYFLLTFAIIRLFSKDVHNLYRNKLKTVDRDLI